MFSTKCCVGGTGGWVSGKECRLFGSTTLGSPHLVDPPCDHVCLLRQTSVHETTVTPCGDCLRLLIQAPNYLSKPQIAEPKLSTVCAKLQIACLRSKFLIQGPEFRAFFPKFRSNLPTSRSNLPTPWSPRGAVWSPPSTRGAQHSTFGAPVGPPTPL